MVAVRSSAFIFLLSLVSPFVLADSPADNLAENVRPIPPEGIPVPDDKRASLESGLSELQTKIEALQKTGETNPVIQQYLPDVEICYKAVRDALQHNEFFKPNEIDFAHDLLETGNSRAASLAEGKAPWTKETGFVFRGYRSRIDGSVQPYGLEIPQHYRFESNEKWRLDFWFHGRGEKLSEVSFIQQRRTGAGGKIKPDNAIVLHPYGRYSNANKFAGEVDLFEALAHAQKDYRIDEDRILVRGFSMGGAACWQFAVHFPGLWAAAQPGAGFSETPDFLKTFQGETLNPSWWEEKLWRWNDATDWALNLANVPTIAYSGEKDRQKQAADMMVAAAEKEGLSLLHIIGPDTEHKIHPDSLIEIEDRLADIAKSGRRRVPSTIHFVTYTLRYNRIRWVQVDRLSEHWVRSEISARINDAESLAVTSSGIEEFSFHFAPGDCPFDPTVSPKGSIDGVEIPLPKPLTDRSWEVYFQKGENGQWTAFPKKKPAGGLTKQHGLQGPIDDAFTDSFVFVDPTGKPQYDLIGEWSHAERARAKEHWRKQFRGDARVLKDREIEEDSLAKHNLILWGDPSSNSFLAKIENDLPIQWSTEAITVGGESFDSKHHVLAMIYPNPLNPERYIVLNSGFTYREYDYLNNARQTPKLPDWAVIDLRQKPDSRYPGKIVAAGFFDEDWELTSSKK